MERSSGFALHENHNFATPKSNDAIQEWNRDGDTVSLASRTASWGTRRRSPSLLDFSGEQAKGGNFLTRISISEDQHQSSIFAKVLSRVANIVRQRKDSKLKRSRASQDIPGETRVASQGNVAPPSITSSFGKRPTHGIKTAVA
jgi:hypothetical protein